MPPTTHARASASKADMWCLCPGALAFCEANKDKIVKRSSPDADLGKIQHSWNEKLVLGEVQLEDIPEQHRQWAELWGNVISDLEMAHPHSQAFVEARVPLPYSPEEEGTVDFALVSDSAIHIRDYKHGVGVPVSAEFNRQLSIYAWAFIVEKEKEMMYDWGPATLVTVGIHQPRYHGEEALKVWTTTKAELLDFCENEIQPAYDKVESGDTTLNPTEKGCRWCPASQNRFCKVKAEADFGDFPEGANPLKDFEDLDLPEPDTLTDEQLVGMFAHKKRIEEFLNGLESYMTARHYDGKPLSGTKLVMGRKGNRKITSEEEMRRILRNQRFKMDDYTTTHLLSLTDLEEVPDIKEALDTKPRFKNIFYGLIERSPAKRVLAMATDKRDAVDPVDALPAEFTNLDETEE